jgi:hypothetical protein
LLAASTRRSKNVPGAVPDFGGEARLVSAEPMRNCAGLVGTILRGKRFGWLNQRGGGAVRTLLMVVALAVSGLSHASAQISDQMITCWYDANGDKTGTDGANMPGTLGLKQTTKVPGNYYFGYNIWAPDGTSCPRKMTPAATKVCSSQTANGWIYYNPVPFTWTIDDCVAFAPGGANVTQLVCIFETGQSTFSRGPAATAPNKPTPPNPNCGW